MLPKGQYFTSEELLEFCNTFQTTILKSETMQKPTYTGDSNVIEKYTPQRIATINVVRQASKLPSLIILPSHLTSATAHLAPGQGVTKAFLAENVIINDKQVDFFDLLEELQLRPTVISQIVVAHNEAFDVVEDVVALKLSIINESIFSNNRVYEIVGNATEPDEEGKISYVFDCTGLEYPLITNGSTKVTLDGIGTANVLTLKLIFGVSYGIF